jgi:hypothetical protein
MGMVPKKTFYSYPPALSFSVLSLFFHPSYLLSGFISLRFFSSFSLSFHYIHSTCARLSHSPHSTPSCTFFPLLPFFSRSSFPHLNLAIIFHSLALSLLKYSGISSVIHLSYFLLYLDSLILSLLF